jgi:hypothetical protein
MVGYKNARTLEVPDPAVAGSSNAIETSMLKTVSSAEPGDRHLTELLAANEAVNWSWDPSCVVLDQAGVPVPASSTDIVRPRRSTTLRVIQLEIFALKVRHFADGT